MASSGRMRQFPPEAPDAATLARPRQLSTAHDPFGATNAGPFGRTDATGAEGVGGRAADGRQAGQPRSRWLAIAAGGSLLAAAGVVAVLALNHSGGQTAGTPTGTGQSTRAGGGQDAIGPGAAAPGQPAVTATRIGASQVKFSWTYANGQPGDLFRWWRVSGPGSHAPRLTSKATVVLPVARGQSVCIEVQVRRANGTASAQSQPGCWPR